MSSVFGTSTDGPFVMPLSIEDEGSRVRDHFDLGAVSELHEAGQLGDKARRCNHRSGKYRGSQARGKDALQELLNKLFT